MMRFTATLFILLMTLSVFAQENPRNTGLSEPQAASTNPVSKASYPTTARKEKVKPNTQLIKTSDNELLITQGWEMIEAQKLKHRGDKLSGDVDTEEWYNAVVPGTVLTTLVEQEVYPDPYFGLNRVSLSSTAVASMATK